MKYFFSNDERLMVSVALNESTLSLSKNALIYHKNDGQLYIEYPDYKSDVIEMLKDIPHSINSYANCVYAYRDQSTNRPIVIIGRNNILRHLHSNKRVEKTLLEWINDKDIT